MDIAMSRRVARAFLAGEATVEARDLLINAAQVSATFDNLPERARALLLDLERRGAARADPDG